MENCGTGQEWLPRQQTKEVLLAEKENARGWRALPKSKIGEAFTYASNQWSTFVWSVEDGRLTIDNSPAEQAIRPLAIGRRNWLQIAGDGGLKSAAVLLSMAATAKRHGVNPWVYVKHILSASAGRKSSADFNDLLPDAWVQAHARSVPAAV